jgi:penicillin-binding protein 1A
MLNAVVKEGTARRADLGYTPQGGKTGTNQGYRDAWYVGFTANTVTGVWVGNDDFSPMNEVTGGKIPAPLWKSITDVAEKKFKPKALAGLPLDGSYTQVAAAEPAQTAAVSDESPDVTVDTAAATPSDDPGQDVLNGMFNLFDKKPTLRNNKVGKRKSNRASRKQRGQNAALQLPRANARAAPKRNFLDSLFRPQGQKKRRKPLFSF